MGPPHRFPSPPSRSPRNGPCPSDHPGGPCPEDCTGVARRKEGREGSRAVEWPGPRALEEAAMPGQEVDRPLSEAQRMEIFQALVEAQDGEMSVPQSRKAVAERFGVSEQQVRRIEREGLDGNWPPLG